jgi:hypothetical protein
MSRWREKNNLDKMKRGDKGFGKWKDIENLDWNQNKKEGRNIVHCLGLRRSNAKKKKKRNKMKILI